MIRLEHTSVLGIGRATIYMGFYDTGVAAIWPSNLETLLGALGLEGGTTLGEAGSYHAPRMSPRHTTPQIGLSWKTFLRR